MMLPLWCQQMLDVINGETEAQSMTSVEWQGAGRGGRNSCSLHTTPVLEHMIRSHRLCPVSHGTRRDVPAEDRAPGESSPSGGTLPGSALRWAGGAKRHDRHQLDPGDEALEVGSCHPSRRHDI